MPVSIQEACRTPNTLDQKRNSSKHIIIRTTNVLSKDRILNAIWKKGQVTYKSRPIRITPDFSPETSKARDPGQMSYRPYENTNASPGYYTQQNSQLP
jgi:hypothetical protein